MFIYSILVREQRYIGLDTQPAYKQHRWNSHCRTADKPHSIQKVHIAMQQHGIKNCIYEVIEDGFDDIVALALAEIKYIKEYDTKNNGLNSTHGGDGIGVHLHTMTNAEIDNVRAALSKSLTEYNNNEKWADTTSEDRIERTAHLHTQEIYDKRGKTLTAFYKENPDVKKDKGAAIVKWQKENREKLLKTNRENGRKAIAVTGLPVKVITPEGETFTYESKSAFRRAHGFYNIDVIIKYTAQGKTHNGWKAWNL